MATEMFIPYSENVLNPLKNYLDKKNIGIRAFSRITGISVATISNVYNGRPVSFRIAKKICKHCNGDLTLQEFGYGDIEK